MTATRAQRALLTFLADEGPILSAEGLATTDLAEAMAAPSVAYLRNMVKALADAELLERDYDLGRRHTYRIAITEAGRVELNRNRFVQSLAPVPKVKPAYVPAMPVCGPIARQPFDADAVRVATAYGSVR